MTAPVNMRISVILSTYNQPEWLEKALRGFVWQTCQSYELVIADDGSGEETAAVVERLRGETDIPIRHVWHEDLGFRKTVILNKAILATDSDYLIFSDGDCVPRSDFVATHARLAKPGHYLSGGYVKLPMEVSVAISASDIQTGRFADPGWLRSQGYRPGYRILRMMRGGRMPELLDWATRARSRWHGNNASTWRSALDAINGFDNDMQYGSEDRALGERLRNAGTRGIKIRHRAPTFHLDHGRPYRDPRISQQNHERCIAIRKEGTVRARYGLDELRSSVNPGPPVKASGSFGDTTQPPAAT